MPNSLCESITREKSSIRWLCPPPFRVYILVCVWLSGSTVETPKGWPHGNNTNSRGLIITTYIVGSVYRDIGWSYMRTHKHAHTRARAPTRPREHKKSGERKGRSRSSDLAILQRWQARGSLLRSASALALPLTTALTASSASSDDGPQLDKV